ncbi:VOC family protein [Phytohabitans sp. LJ34]|uniref:VOC family protein n=1 Tax=Phytohabitans sp. LJ34 TaxID=3452217 RepID=UPI003F887CED
MFDEIFPILTARDLPAALGFYRDLLGGTVTYQFPPEGEPAYVAVDLGRSHLGIGRQDQPGDLVNDRVTLWVYAGDCDAAVDRLRAAGVPVLQEPADQPWGERMATVTDPDGNRVIVATRAPAG